MFKILYITTAYTGTMRYLSWQSYPDIAYSRLQRNVLSLLENYQQNGHIVHARLYPNKYAIDPSFLFAKERNITILDAAPPAILQQNKYDFIITEAIATTLLEALCTQSQIILYYDDQCFKILNEYLNILDRRVFLEKNEKNYMNKIRNMALLEKKKVDDYFLNHFGLPENIKDSPDQLATSAIMNVLNGNL